MTNSITSSPTRSSASLPGLNVIQLTDTHLFADDEGQVKGFQTARSLAAVVDRVRSRPTKPDLLLLTGDLSQDETLGSYQRLRSQLAPLGIPAYWLPGNHDQYPEQMAQVLADAPFSVSKWVQQGGWNFVLLDSSQFGQVDGVLSEASLLWLEERLQVDGSPTLVALHHPPLAIGSTWMDRIGLQNRDALFAVLDRYPQVKLVLFGHIHQEFDRVRRGVRYLGCPSTCVQFVPGDEFAIDVGRSPGFRWLTLYPDGSYETQVERVEFFAEMVSLHDS